MIQTIDKQNKNIYQYTPVFNNYVLQLIFIFYASRPKKF